MKAEISYDLDMTESMAFVEGTFRLPDGYWQVFIFGPDESVSHPQVRRGKWESGVTGVFVKWPVALTLNKTTVTEILSREFGVTEWDERRGPDSIRIR